MIQLTPILQCKNFVEKIGQVECMWMIFFIFYQLKKFAKHAKADNNLVCNILIGQLPKVIQSNAKTLFAEKKGTGLISVTNASVLLSKVKELMNDRGIPPDIGCHRFDEISEQSKPSAINVVGQGGASRKELSPTAQQP